MKVLMAEDNKESRDLLERLLQGHGHEVTAVVHGAEALEQALARPPDIIISDIMMPVMDGFQLCQECKQNEQLKNIPFIFYTATYTSDEDERFALSLGADAFIIKPAEPDTLVRKLSEEFEKAKHRSLVSDKVVPLEPSLYLTEYNKRIVAKLEKKMADLEVEITERKRLEEELKQSYEKLQEAMDRTIKVLAITAEWRDSYTVGHQQRVAELACAIAEEINLPEEQIKKIYMSALIHDIGKINVPYEILNKPGRMSDPEFKIIQTHPEVGYNILKRIEFPWPIAQIILQHHEKMDGSGYPQGLSGEEIYLEARILCVADVVEAMVSDRPYRPPP
ncbi:MAG: HD domain-containing protein, partial [Deltaproteobacteria bacterium]|nr:HD domain-containing protein [Deltaproteobacteria bacterium]